MNNYSSYSTNGGGGGAGGGGVNHLSAGIPGLAPSPLTPSVLSSMASELMTHNNNQHLPASHQGLGSGGQGLNSTGFSYPSSPTTSTTFPGFSRTSSSSVHSPPHSPLSSHDTTGSSHSHNHNHSTNSSLPPTPVPTASGNISQAMVASAVVQVTPLLSFCYKYIPSN